MSNLNEIIQNIKDKNFDQALKLCNTYENEKNKHIIFNLRGAIYFSQNDLINAETNFVESFKINNNFIDSIKNLILIYNRKKNFKKFLFFAKKLVEIDKSNPLFNFQLGFAYGQNQDQVNSKKHYKISIKIDQNYRFMVFNNIGSTYAKTQKFKKSNRYYFKALKFNINNKIIINNVLSNYLGLRDKENAYVYFKKAEKLDQNYIEFLYNKAEYLILNEKFAEAVQILEENKNNLRFLVRLIKIYFTIGKNQEAQLLFNSSKKILVNNFNGINFLGMRLLYEGDFLNGWKYYDQGALKSDHSFKNIKEWNGENLERKHIVVFNEQGLGDAIQFSKYIIPLLEISNEVTFIIKKNIHKIFRSDIPNLNIGSIDMISNYKFDFKIALGSLIKFFYKKKIRYNKLITNNNDNVRDLDIIKFDLNKLNVGIAWSGSFNGPNEPYRSIPLKSLNRIFSLDVNYFCLQNEIWDRDLNKFNSIKINNFGKYSLNEMSSIIPNLDLVISTDTSFLHLSSALNQETWGILNLYPDWRWGEFNKLNPYKSLKLFRQKIFNKWDDVELEIFENLKKKIKNKELSKK